MRSFLVFLVLFLFLAVSSEAAQPSGIAPLFEAAAVTGEVVALPPGDYTIEKTIELGPVSGLTVRGAGAPVAGQGPGTRLRCKPGVEVGFELTGVRESSFADFTVLDCPTAFVSNSKLGSIATNITWDRVRVEGTDYGFRLGTDGPDYNNDMHVWRDVYITGVRKVGIEVLKAQAKGLKIIRGAVLGDPATMGTGTYGLKGNGSYKIDGWAGGMIDTVVHTVPNDPLIMRNMNFEQVERLLEVPYNGNPFNITVESVRVGPERIAPDGCWLYIGTPGPTLINQALVIGPQREGSKPAHIRLYRSGTPISARIFGIWRDQGEGTGVMIHSYGMAPFEAIPGENAGTWGRVDVGGVYTRDGYTPEKGYPQLAP